MPPATAQRTIRSAILERTFQPVYYLFGEDDYLKDQAVRELVDAAVDPATRDFNLEIRRGADIDAGTLGSLLATPPMMADRRAVVVKDVPSLKKDARKALDAYLAQPAADTLLVLTAPAGAKADKELADRTVPVEFEPLTGDRVPRWISFHVEQTLSTTITADAVSLLQDAVGNDLSQLVIELDKLASYAGGNAIDASAVTAVVGIRPDETVGALLDAVARHDARAAVSMIGGILQQPKTSGVTIVMALTTQTLAIMWARARRARGTSASRLDSELFALLKEAGSAYTGRSWGDAVKAWSSAASLASGPDMTTSLNALLAADRALKESRVSGDEQILTSLVLGLCAGGVS